MFEVLQRGNDFLLNFVGGVILGGFARLLVGLAGMAIVVRKPLPDADAARAWLAIASTVGPVSLLGVATLLTVLVKRRGLSFGAGFFLGCLAAALVWFAMIAASAGSR